MSICLVDERQVSLDQDDDWQTVGGLIAVLAMAEGNAPFGEIVR
jgi:hypothetical protein